MVTPNSNKCGSKGKRLSHTAGWKCKIVLKLPTLVLPKICRTGEGVLLFVLIMTKRFTIGKQKPMTQPVWGVGPTRRRDHLLVQLSFLTIMQESGLSLFPIRKWLWCGHFTTGNKKRYGRQKEAGMLGTYETGGKRGWGVGGWTSTPCF